MYNLHKRCPKGDEKMGVKIKGVLSGMDEKIGEYDGVKKITYRYLLVAGMSSFLITSDQDYREMLQIGDVVTFEVDVRVYGGKVYYSKGMFLNE